MSNSKNPTVIGAFVIGAVVLVIAGILVFGAGLFAEKDYVIIYFDGPIKGLNKGAPATLKGVQVGSVSHIYIEYDEKAKTFRTPVVVELIRGTVHYHGNGKPEEWADPETMLTDLVRRGIRAQLNMQSFVTGQLYIEFIFKPESPVRLVGRGEFPYPEIPTIPSLTEEAKDVAANLMETVRKLPLDQLVAKLTAVLDEIHTIAMSPETKEMTRSLNQTLKDMGELARTLDARVESLAVSAEGTLKEAQKLIHNTDVQLAPVAARFIAAAQEAQAALQQARTTMAGLKENIGSKSAVQYELTKTMRDVSDAAQAVRVLTDYLQQHPSSALFGKAKP